MSEVNMQAVADLAGVSRITVSRVLRSPHLVRPETRERILAIIDRLGYVYHAAAADLIRGKTSIIGLILPTIRTLVFAETILAVQNASSELGMNVILGSSQYDPVLEERLLRQFQGRRLAGLILVGYTPGREEQILSLQEGGIPSVVIWNTPIPGSALNQVGFDNRKATLTMMEYLLGLGHRRIGLISGPEGAGVRVRERVNAYREALAAHGIPYDPGLTRAVEPTIANGETEARHLLTWVSPRPSAIFAASDNLAIGAISAAKNLGISVPGDLSVCGFDNMDFSAHSCPPLTTVNVPDREMARIAARRLRSLIQGDTPASPLSVCLKTRLVIRESCAPPSARGVSLRACSL